MDLQVWAEAETVTVSRDGVHSADESDRVSTDSDRPDIALIGFTHLSCTNPRDKVCEMLGPVRPEDRISVEYQEEPSQVFLDTIRATKLGLRVCDRKFEIPG